MASTIQEISQYLNEADINYHRADNLVTVAFGTQHYVNPMDQKFLIVCLLLDEDGRYLSITAPHAFRTEGHEDHLEAALRACMSIQWRTKMIQFEYDDRQGEIRPVVEFPLEDAALTAKQLQRALMGLVQLVDTYYPVLKRALDTGDVDLNLTSTDPVIEDIDAFLDGLSEEKLLEALIRKQKQTTPE